MKTEVVVIGGGATGAGVLRDLALRGIEAVLLEQEELTSGTSGRNHGLLHSGARYAVNDPDSARECLAENKILKKIASPCIEPMGGFFLALPQDPPHYADDLLRACAGLDLPAVEVPPADVLQKEPALSPKIKRAICVPDASIDPFRLIRSNVEEAERLGAKIFPHRRVVAIFTADGTIHGLQAIDSKTGEEFHIACRFIINAAGVWAGSVARMAGARLDILFSKGSLVILNRRLVNSVINRCRPPSNGDILVPHGPALIIGTTSQTVTAIEDPSPEEEEVDLLLSEGETILPEIGSTRAIRAYAGVRPLMGAREAGEDSRKISRDFLLLDHGEADQIKGLFSIVGGKLTTYRLMAERTVDEIVKAMGGKTSCTTAGKPLPFPEEYTFHDLGSKLRKIGPSKSIPQTGEILCECELVFREDIVREIQNQPYSSLKEIQERTRAGMGPCQGGFCSPRLTALLSESGKIPPGTSLPILKRFLEERWKGTRPVMWGPQLREEQLIQALYTEFFNLDHF
ncbi:MAG: anaerobic glycerol-3-phosphate dehydrogenase subunit GlpA [Deltaproteobacteria bacterium]|nr:anaerobic glycerol-3-phosphate dehydrogenase subunit GlpA [Deltaproteobacteria bacterium]